MEIARYCRLHTRACRPSKALTRALDAIDAHLDEIEPPNAMPDPGP